MQTLIGKVEYFYAKNGQQLGPVPDEALKQLALAGELRRADKVWCKGMAQWQQAESVPGLFEGLPPDLKPDLAVNTPPPLPDRPESVQAASKAEWGFWVRIIGIGLLILAVYWKLKHHMYWGQSDSEVRPASTEAASQVAAREKDQAELLNRVKTELSTAGIADDLANKAAPYIMARLNSGEPLSPEAAAQASAMGIVPIPFSKTVIDEYSNWVHETTSVSESVN